MQFFIKTIISAFLIATIATVSKKFTLVGSILASLPITSILAMIWLYQGTKDATKIIDLSYSIFWMVVPSLIFFIVLPLLLKKELNFYLSLFLASGIMVFSYFLYIKVLKHIGINL